MTEPISDAVIRLRNTAELARMAGIDYDTAAELIQEQIDVACGRQCVACLLSCIAGVVITLLAEWLL